MTVKTNYHDESILIVDDNDLVRDTLYHLVTALGFSAKVASDGMEALETLERHSFTFLLTDMKMPGMDGMDLIRKARQRFPDLSIISMTGHSEGYRYVDVIHAGASDFIKKPFDIEELEAKVSRIIGERSLREELNRLSMTDSLTGLFNHRQFFERLREELIRATRQKEPLSIVLFDLDDFKSYNDTYGHLAGDEVLRDVGGIILKCIREGVDTGYRYGGDEFAVILIGATMEVAQTIVRRMENSFDEYGKIGASFGVSRLEDGMSEKELVSAADQNLYEMKQKRKAARGAHQK